MDRYDEVLSRARFQEGLPREISRNLEEWRERTYFKEDDIEKWQKEEWVYDLATFFWTTRRFDDIGIYSTIFESNNAEEPNCFRELEDLSYKYRNANSPFEKEIIYADGFAVVYESKIALQKYKECLSVPFITVENELKIRNKMQEIYYYSELGTTDEERENQRRIITLGGFDKKQCTDYLSGLFLGYKKEEEDFIVEILKKYEEVEIWDLLYEKICSTPQCLVEIYKKVQPSIVLNEHIYLELMEIWLLQRKYEEIDKVIRKNVISDGEKIACFDIKRLIAQAKIEEADKKLNLFLCQYPKNDELSYYKICTLHSLEKYEEVLEWISKVGMPFDSYGVLKIKFLSLMRIDKIHEAIDFFADFYNTGQLDNSVVYYVISEKEINSDIAIKILDKLKAHINMNREWGIPKVFIPYVLNMTEQYKEKGWLRNQLIQIYMYANSIKNMLRIDPEIMEEIYHYSPPSSLKYLPQYSKEIGGSKFRLGNAAYLNDPEEGKVFFKILEKTGCSIINEIFEDSELKYENTYLASFSGKKDFLPMWVQYAEDGKGVCYALDTSVFGYNEFDIEKHIYHRLTYNKYNLQEERYVLYKVYYYNTEELDANDSKVIALCDEIAKLLGEIAQYMNNSEIKELVVNIINSIRYLFKDVAYANEDEIRIISIDYYDKKLIDIVSEEVPRFYRELDKEIYFNRIILGPKSEDIRKKATYLSCCKNVGGVEKSKIKYV